VRVGAVYLLSDVNVHLFKRRRTSMACTSRQRGLKSNGVSHPVKGIVQNKGCATRIPVKLVFRNQQVIQDPQVRII
jgi:hypothetical protein